MCTRCVAGVACCRIERPLVHRFPPQLRWGGALVIRGRRGHGPTNSLSLMTPPPALRGEERLHHLGGRRFEGESLMRMQPMVIGHHYMASAGQYLATEAAHAILSAGGNAIDAGVAGGIALGVVHS